METVQLDRSMYVMPENTPVCALDCRTAFENLNMRKKKYAHHMARACWEGQLIVFCQYAAKLRLGSHDVIQVTGSRDGVSPESPAIFALVYELFRSEPFHVLRKRAVEELGWSVEEFTALLGYTGGICSMGGNYDSHADTKIVPDVEPKKLRALFESSRVKKLRALFESSQVFAKNAELRAAYDRVEDRMFALDDKDLRLAFPEKAYLFAKSPLYEHCCARYVLLRVCMAAGKGLVSVEECMDTDGKPDLKFRLDRSKVVTVGKPAVSDFLLKLQVYKSTGNAEEGIKFFREWSAVGKAQLRWREVVLARRQPRRLLVQPNTVIDANGEVQLLAYPETVEGLVQSFVERHSPESVQDLLSVWKEDAAVFGLP